MKKIISCTLVFLLMLAMVGCSSNNSSERGETVSNDEQTIILSTDFEQEYNIKNEDAIELFSSIKTNMLEYFNQNSIDYKTYQWSDDPTDWYVFDIYTTYCISEEKDPYKDMEKTVNYLNEQDSLSTDNEKIMQKVGETFVLWIGNHLEYKNVDIRMIPWFDIIPKNIDFTK